MTIFSTPTVPGDTCIHRIASILDRFDLAALFPKPQPVEVELGAGDGSFLAAYCARNPERNFIGVERLLGRLRKIDRKARRAGLRNLRLIRLEASYFVEYMLPPNSVDALHVYFPDPWPKRKHRKNRLINAHFVELIGRVLKPGGVIYLRTDDADYFAQMTEVFSTARDFCLVQTPDELAMVITDFERNFNARGVRTNRAAYQLRAESP